MWQLDFAVFVLTICWTTAACHWTTWPFLMAVWLTLVMQPLGCLVAQWIYLRSPTSMAVFTGSRLVLSAALPIVTMSLLGFFYSALVLARNDIDSNSSRQFSVRKLIATTTATVLVFWLTYPADFYSPHRFHLLDVIKLYDSYNTMSVDVSTVTGGYIKDTYLVLPVFQRKRLPIPALAAFLVFGSVMLAGAVSVYIMAKDKRRRWLMFHPQVRRAVLCALCLSAATFGFVVALVALDPTPESVIPWKGIAIGIILLASMPAAVWLRHRSREKSMQ
jgi:hypothetical protein